MSVNLNDRKTLEAIGILADVLDDMAGPERLECLMAANALRQVLETKSETALNFARQAFESLDPGVRRQIRDKSNETAVKVMEELHPGGAPGRIGRMKPKPSLGPIVDALSSGGMTIERKW